MQKDILLPRVIEAVGVLLMIVGVVLAVVASINRGTALLLIGVGGGLFVGGDLGVFYMQTGSLRDSLSLAARDLVFPVILGLSLAVVRLLTR